MILIEPRTLKKDGKRRKKSFSSFPTFIFDSLAYRKLENRGNRLNFLEAQKVELGAQQFITMVEIMAERIELGLSFSFKKEALLRKFTL